jgi:predicted dehydrogenase
VRTIRVAVIGAGDWGPNLIRNFDNKNTSEVAWVVDSDHRRLEQVRMRFPDVSLSSEPADAFGDGSVDAAVIATPTVTHYSLAKAALQAGKHVLVEKPVTSDLAQAEELCALSAKLGRILMVGHVFLYNAAVRKVKRSTSTPIIWEGCTTSPW